MTYAEDTHKTKDYRKLPRALSQTCFEVMNSETEREFEKLFEAMISSSKEPAKRRELKVWGRSVVVPEATEDVARFTFRQLCGTAAAAADYLAIAQTFKVIFISDVHRLSYEQRDQVCAFPSHGKTLPKSRTGQTVHHVRRRGVREQDDAVHLV